MAEKRKKMIGGITGKGFDVNPQNAIHNGRKPSIKTRLKKILATGGELPIPKKLLTKEDDDNYYFKVPNDEILAMKLVSLAMSRKSHVSLKAIQTVLEHIDGKPKQKLEVETDNVIKEINLKVIDNKENKDDKPGN